jgi:antitoxin MazE
VKARLVNIGNSRGVRLPKPLIEAAGLVDQVDLRVRNGAIIIAASRSPRAGWAEAAERLAKGQRYALLDLGTRTHFDVTEWEW